MKYRLRIVVAILAIVGLIYLISSYDWEYKRFMTNDYFNDRTKFRGLCRIAYEHMNNSHYNNALYYYMEAYKKFPTDSIAVRITDCECLLGNYASAIGWLDSLKYPDKAEDFYDLKRAHIMLCMSDTAQMSRTLDRIISSPVRKEEVGLFRRLFDQVMNDDENYTSAINHYRYYVKYLGHLLALHSKLSMCRTHDECFDQGRNLFRLVDDQEDDYAIMYEYLDIISRYNGFNSLGYNDDFSDIEKSVQYMSGILYDRWNIVNMVSMVKWDIFNRLIMMKHNQDGFDATVKYINEITDNNTENTDAYLPFDKFIYEIYIGASNPTLARSSLNKKEIDSILRMSYDPTLGIRQSALTIAYESRSIFSDNSLFEYLEGDKIVGQIIVLGCNDWNWDDPSIDFVQYVANNADKRKELRFIDEFFVAGNAYTNKEKFGVGVFYYPYTQYGLNLIQAEYNKQQSK